jgi:hypothetical protein
MGRRRTVSTNICGDTGALKADGTVGGLDDIRTVCAHVAMYRLAPAEKNKLDRQTPQKALLPTGLHAIMGLQDQITHMVESRMKYTVAATTYMWVSVPAISGAAFF